jgi:isopentenyl-diphosphate delta-isomerase
MESAHAHRKDEHLALAESEFRRNAPLSSLRDVRIMPVTLPETSTEQVDMRVQDANFTFDFPFYIEAMTGGSKKTGEINEKLAIAARETGLAMAVGSQSVAIKDASAADTFKVARKINPDGFLIANVGAGKTLQDAREAVNMIEANALEVHVNVTQEVVMPEGDRTFIWQDELANIIANVGVPVIIKEVGFGMTSKTIALLRDLGAEYINLGGKSGTNFAIIEDRRNRNPEDKHEYLYDWGLSTAESLIEAGKVSNAPTIFATGGIQDPLDVLKAQIMGAKSVGIAGHFLHTVLNNDTDGLITEITSWQNQLTKLMAMVGAKTQSDLRNLDVIYANELFNFWQQRQ